MILTRRHYALLALGLALFVVYGSLVPFQYQPLPWSLARDRFALVLREPIGIDSRSDWLANVMLVVPLGFLLMGALCVDRGRLALLSALAVLPACLVLSTAVEFAQLWFPPRVSSVNDIAAQGVGELAGVAAWLAAGPRLTAWIRGFWTAVGTRGLAAQLLPGYLALLALIHGIPFDLTLSPKDFRRKWRHGAIRLVPFAGADGNVLPAVEKGLWNVALFLPLGLLLAYVTPSRDGREDLSWWRVLLLGLAATLLIQGLKLFVVSRYVDAGDVVTGTLAVLLGWRLAVRRRRLTPFSPDGREVGGERKWIALQPPLDSPATHSVREWIALRLHTHTTQNSPSPVPEVLGRRGRVVIVLLATWLAAAVFVNWQPFDFTPKAAFVAGRLRQMSLVPFADYYWGNYWNGFDQFVHKLVLFVPLGVLLTVALPTTRARGLLVVGLAALTATALEAGQLFLPTRFASITDVLIETSGAWVGLLATQQGRLLLGRATEAGIADVS